MCLLQMNLTQVIYNDAVNIPHDPLHVFKQLAQIKMRLLISIAAVVAVQKQH